MKSKTFAVLMLAVSLSPLTLFAASKNSQFVTFSKSVNVGGTAIAPGDYKVQWEGTGNVTATILHGKKVVATVPATVTDTKSSFDGALHFRNGVLEGIFWKNASIDFTHSTSPDASSSGN